MPDDPPATFTLVLRDADKGVALMPRLRRLCKRALRAYGFVLVEFEETASEKPTPPESEK